MIKVTDLTKHFGPVEALKGISFDVQDGEIVGFLGANGAGKSTTLRVITGYLVPTSGKVEVNDLNILDHATEIQRQIGYLPEFNPLYGEMTVYDFLQFVAEIRAIRGRRFREALARVVEQCGLKGVVHRSIGTCSKGYRQRVGLAAAMIHNPAILIMDEPVSGLDPNQIVEIRELIKALGREKLVLISSHILQEVQATVDRIIIIHEGQIVANGTSEELMSSFMGQVRLILEVKDASGESLEGLILAVPGVKLINQVEQNGGWRLDLEYSRQEDPREAIFNYAVDQHWVVLKMNPHSANLEDIFRQLTISEKALG